MKIFAGLSRKVDRKFAKWTSESKIVQNGQSKIFRFSNFRASARPIWKTHPIVNFLSFGLDTGRFRENLSKIHVEHVVEK